MYCFKCHSVICKCKKNITLPKLKCLHCAGTGRERIFSMNNWIDDQRSYEVTCRFCGGKGS